MKRLARAGWLAAVVCLFAAPVSAQLTLPPGSPLLPAAPTEGAARRGPVTIVPTLTLTGEYNDNVFQSNANKVSDFILGIAPGISVSVESPIYRLIGSYSFTTEIYADQTQLNQVFSRQNLNLDGSYRITPLLTVSLTDTLFVSNDTNNIAAENVSTGRTRSVSNTLSPALAYQIEPRTVLRLRGTWTMLRYDSDLALDSDTYAAEVFVDRAFSQRLTGSAGYQFAYFDVQDSPWVVTHTPRIGITYRFTATTTAMVSGGPTFQVPETGSTDVFPAVTASLQERFPWGSATVQYDHAIGTSGGLGGTTENRSIGAVVQLDRLLRGFVLQFSPRYTRSTSTAGDAVEVDTISLTLQARYEINRYMAAFAGYTYFRQRSDSVVTTAGGTILANDVDQNRVFIGLQFGYPITVD